MAKFLITVLVIALFVLGVWYVVAGCFSTAAAAQEPSPAPAAREPGVDVKAELESLEAAIQTGLEELEVATAQFNADHKKWQALDQSMASARSVNAALLARNKAVVGLYESKLKTQLDRFRERLAAAPAVYRKLAEDRQRLVTASTLEVERRNYVSMAQTCEAAAVLCETRFQELFGAEAVESRGGQDAPRSNAVTLKRTMENMKRLQPMHEKWEETFKAYPTALETNGLKNWFDELSLYGEDVERFTRGVEQLKDTMKRKVAAAETTPSK